MYSHNNEITHFHDRIVDALMKACEESIPVSDKNNKPKVVPGWNEYVEQYFRTSLFWH